MKIKIGEVTGFSLKKWDNFDWPAVSELDGSLSYTREEHTVRKS